MIRSNYFVKKQLIFVKWNISSSAKWHYPIYLNENGLTIKEPTSVQNSNHKDSKISTNSTPYTNINHMLTSDQIQDATLGVTSEVQPNRMSDNCLSQIMNKSCAVS